MMGVWLKKYLWDTSRWYLWLAIMVGILCVLLPSFHPFHPHNASRAKINATKIEINGNLTTALGQFEANIGRFPTTAEGLRALVECPPAIPRSKWQDQYVDELPQDPWKHEYRYICPSIKPGKYFDLISAGPDGIFGTRDDITNDLPNR